MTEATPEPTIESLQEEVTRLRREWAEQRTKTVDVAQRLARQHGLCSVIDGGLREIGLLGQPTTVTFDVQIPVAVTLQMDSHTLEGLTDEEVTELFKGSTVSGVTWNPVSQAAVEAVANGHRVTADPQTTQMGDIVVNGVSRGAVPAGNANGIWAYSSEEGRVLHFFPGAQWDTRRAPGRRWVQLTRESRRSLCRRIDSYHAYEWSSRGEARNCESCATRAAAS